MNLGHLLKKGVKFSVTSLLGTIADTIVLWVMSKYVFGDNHFEQYVLSPGISFECAVLVNYTVAFFYVWRDRINSSSVRSYFGHFWKYNLSCISAFILKMLILNAIAVATKWSPVICNLLALCVSGLLNFSLNEFLIFRKPSSKEDEEERSSE